MPNLRLRSSSATMAKDPSGRAVAPPLEVMPIFFWSPLAQSTELPHSMPEEVGKVSLELREKRIPCLPTQSSLLGQSRPFFEIPTSGRRMPCSLRRLWLCHSKGSAL